MSEQFDDRNDQPCLFDYEIKALANMVLTRQSDIIDVDHPDIQDPDRPEPHYFRLNLKPEEIDSSWRLRLHDDTDVITGVMIEYNETMMILDDDTPIEPWVTVTVETKLYDFAAGEVIDRELRYRLSLIPGGICNVTERRLDENERAEIDADTIEDAAIILAREPRPLNEDDLQFLRLLISHP